MSQPPTLTCKECGETATLDMADNNGAFLNDCLANGCWSCCTHPFTGVIE